MKNLFFMCFFMLTFTLTTAQTSSSSGTDPTCDVKPMYVSDIVKSVVDMNNTTQKIIVNVNNLQTSLTNDVISVVEPIHNDIENYFINPIHKNLLMDINDRLGPNSNRLINVNNNIVNRIRNIPKLE